MTGSIVFLGSAVVVEVIRAGGADVVVRKLLARQHGPHVASLGCRHEHAVYDAEVVPRLVPLDHEWLDVEIAELELRVVDAVCRDVRSMMTNGTTQFQL